MSRYKNITSTEQNTAGLSRRACSILLQLYYHTDDDNLVNKAELIKNTGIKMDQRTWNKYWKELEEKDVLHKVKSKLWMLSPHHCFADVRKQATMIKQWNEICTINH